jgi:hypothetical protein
MNGGSADQGTPIDGRLPQPVTISWPERTSSVFKRIDLDCSGDLLSTEAGNVAWQVQGDGSSGASTQYRWKLRGGVLAALVTVDCEGSGSDVLFLSDGAEPTSCIIPLGIFDRAAPAGTEITAGVFSFDLGAGMLSRADGNRLLVSARGGIGSGVIQVTGVLWGEEVPK